MSAVLRVVLAGRAPEALTEVEADRLLTDLVDASRVVAGVLVAARWARWRRLTVRTVVRPVVSASVRARHGRRRSRRRVARHLPR